MAEKKRRYQRGDTRVERILVRVTERVGKRLRTLAARPGQSISGVAGDVLERAVLRRGDDECPICGSSLTDINGRCPNPAKH
jgi:hypothetical protein